MLVNYKLDLKTLRITDASEVEYPIQEGPCIICGVKNYTLSGGGYNICPPCDCGAPFNSQTIKNQKEEIERLRAELLLKISNDTNVNSDE